MGSPEPGRAQSVADSDCSSQLYLQRLIPTERLPAVIFKVGYGDNVSNVLGCPHALIFVTGLIPNSGPCRGDQGSGSGRDGARLKYRQKNQVVGHTGKMSQKQRKLSSYTRKRPTGLELS